MEVPGLSMRCSSTRTRPARMRAWARSREAACPRSTTSLSRRIFMARQGRVYPYRGGLPPRYDFRASEGRLSLRCGRSSPSGDEGPHASTDVDRVAYSNLLELEQWSSCVTEKKESTSGFIQVDDQTGIAGETRRGGWMPSRRRTQVYRVWEGDSRRLGR